MSTHQEYNVPTTRERRFAVEWAVETRLEADCLKRDDKRCVVTKRFDELSRKKGDRTTLAAYTDSSGILRFQNKSSERSKDQRSIVG